MKTGRLRVLLGAAPGVGKTYSMLEEGRTLLDEGHDVVVAFVEDHGRAATAAMTVGLELMARLEVTHRGVTLTEMDLAAVLARKPWTSWPTPMPRDRATRSDGRTSARCWMPAST